MLSQEVRAVMMSHCRAPSQDGPAPTCDGASQRGILMCEGHLDPSLRSGTHAVIKDATVDGHICTCIATARHSLFSSSAAAPLNSPDSLMIFFISQRALPNLFLSSP